MSWKEVEYGDIFTITDFAEAVKMRLFSPDDGIGYYCAFDGWTTHKYMENTEYDVWNTPVKQAIRDGYTHVAWYNK